jgi:hypothetical protein
LDLLIVFSGEVPPGIIQFKKTGAYYLAKWISKVIYRLKMYLFWQQFKLTNYEDNYIFDFNLFLIKYYESFWYSAPNANEAPLNNIKFSRTSHEYHNNNEIVSNSTYSIVS